VSNTEIIAPAPTDLQLYWSAAEPPEPRITWPELAAREPRLTSLYEQAKQYLKCKPRQRGRGWVEFVRPQVNALVGPPSVNDIPGIRSTDPLLNTHAAWKVAYRTVSAAAGFKCPDWWFS